ncbi:MAG TPA: DinB family protein [Candidatus Angelobacter sp.]|nr:DinB family protein [Candidatus Angelobacter sp.]
MMAESFQEYAQRIRGYLAGRNPVESMQQAPADLAELLKNLPESVAVKVPQPGKWSIAEIIAHLADTELAAGYRYRAIGGGEDGVPITGFDQDRWAVAGNYHAIKIENSLRSFLAVREMNLRYLKGLPENAWNKHGMHSERGRETLRDLVELAAGHDLNHIAQIRKIVSSTQAA